jgi:hypothetical protein
LADFICGITGPLDIFVIDDALVMNQDMPFLEQNIQVMKLILAKPVLIAFAAGLFP